MKVITPPFRVNFPHVFESHYNELSKKNEYSVLALFPMDADFTEMKKARNRALKDKFGDKLKALKGKLRSPFRDQADLIASAEEKDKIPLDFLEAGAIFINIKSTNKPAIVNQKVKNIIDS